MMFILHQCLHLCSQVYCTGCVCTWYQVLKYQVYRKTTECELDDRTMNIHLARFSVFRSSVLQPEAPQQQCCPQLITARRMVCMILLIVVVSWSLLPKPCRAHGPCLAWPDATGHKIVLALAEIGTGNTAVVPGIYTTVQ